ncbi:MAG: TetR family transcriptional regulator [Actinomycetes bacterium]
MTTRELLLDQAELLFARSSVAGVTTREITEAADQRNTSAISYHFGSRHGLLLAVLSRRGGPVDDHRGELRSQLPSLPTLKDLVACLVRPYCDLLATTQGRAYLRIVAQLRGRFAAWRVESDSETTKHLARILDEIESKPTVSLALRHERVLGLIMLLTGACAERARRIEDGDELFTTETEFVNNLIEMCAGVVMV